MTQPSRTTETINRDNAAIRDIMHQIRELTVPDRATLALGLIGHLATMMNRSQMAKLMEQLQEEAERVQDVPPIRQREDARASGGTEVGESRGSAGGGHADAADRSMGAASGSGPGGRDRGTSRDGRMAAGRGDGAEEPRTKPHGDVLESHVGRDSASGREGVGQAGRGEFRSRKLL